MSEELDQQQQTEISDIIEDFVPATETTEAAEPVEQAAPVESEPVVETKPVEEKVEEVVKDGKEGEERKQEAASGQEQAGKPAEEVKEEVAKPAEQAQPELTEIEKVKKENEELKKHLEEIAERVIAPKPQPQTEQEIAAQKAEQDRQAKQILKFLPSDEVFDEVMKDSNNFNALLTTVVNTAVERSLRLMPQIATQLVDQQITLKTVVNDFYTDNKDLVPHKKYVGFVSNEIAAQHPDWGLAQILQETEKEVRNRLRLSRVADNAVPGQTRVQQIERSAARTGIVNPGFVPGGGGGRKGSASSDGNLSIQEKDILSLIS
jgi:hypothetical protein